VYVFVRDQMHSVEEYLATCGVKEYQSDWRFDFTAGDEKAGGGLGFGDIYRSAGF
jgi:hypothetical protein